MMVKTLLFFFIFMIKAICSQDHPQHDIHENTGPLQLCSMLSLPKFPQVENVCLNPLSVPQTRHHANPLDPATTHSESEGHVIYFQTPPLEKPFDLTLQEVFNKIIKYKIFPLFPVIHILAYDVCSLYFMIYPLFLKLNPACIDRPETAFMQNKNDIFTKVMIVFIGCIHQICNIITLPILHRYTIQTLLMNTGINSMYTTLFLCLYFSQQNQWIFCNSSNSNFAHVNNSCIINFNITNTSSNSDTEYPYCIDKNHPDFPNFNNVLYCFIAANFLIGCVFKFVYLKLLKSTGIEEKQIIYPLSYLGELIQSAVFFQHKLNPA
ncbi:MAG: hypothetical protein HEEMFOPI_01184 [Holosporales bacterium]